MLPPRQEFKRAGYLKTEEVGCLLQIYRYVTVLPLRQEFKRAGYLKTEEVGCCYRCICDCAPSTTGIQAGTGI